MSTGSRFETGNNEDVSINTHKKPKSTRSPFSCDLCRRRKSDSNLSRDGRCSNCLSNGVECSHSELTKTIGSAKSYVERLEATVSKLEGHNEQLQTRVTMLERLFAKVLPDMDLEKAINEDPSVYYPAFVVGSSAGIARNDDDDCMDTLGESMKSLALSHSDEVFGKASLIYLVHTALYIKAVYDGASRLQSTPWWGAAAHWKPGPWLSDSLPAPLPRPIYVFPEPDLLHDLVDLYFINLNTYLPLLHRPTFDKSLKEEVHLSSTDSSRFAEIVLLVSALGSRYSNDPRVFLADLHGAAIEQSAGWKWFVQVNIDPRDTPSLGLVQMYALSVQYKPSVYMPHWVDLGFAMRLALDIGTHQRKKIFSPKTDRNAPTADNELRKRAFWVIFLLDRDLGSTIGRPNTLSEEDFDQDLPIECDDEYWNHPDPQRNFVQPPNTPSKISYFVLRLQLSRIQLYTMRKVYYQKKPPPPSFQRRVRRSEHDIIAELDSAMTTWLDSVPAYLRWDPDHEIPETDEADVFRRQSMHLYIAYYQLQILAHRAFIPTPNVSSELSFPSLTICTSAARSCIQVAKATLSPRPWFPASQVHVGVGTAALILLLNGWSKKNYERSEMGKRDAEYIVTAITVLKTHAVRMGCGRFIGMLVALTNSENNDAPGIPGTSNKRHRDFDTDTPGINNTRDTAWPEGYPSRQFAGTNRVHATVPSDRVTAPSIGPFSMANNMVTPFNGDVMCDMDTILSGSFDDSTLSPSIDANSFGFLDDPAAQYQSYYGLFDVYNPDTMVGPSWSAGPTSLDHSEWDSFIRSLGLGESTVP